MRKIKLLGLLCLLSLSSSCFGNWLTAAEIRDAVIGVQLMGEARQAVDDVVEISTSFTLGDAAEAIVEIANFGDVASILKENVTG